MKNPVLLAAGLLVILSLLGFSLYELLGDDTAAETGDVVTQARGGDDDANLPEPAPGRKVAFTSMTPREKLRQEKLEAAESELAWVKEHGEKVGDFYRVEVDGQEYFILGELAKGFGRNGQPIYSTVKATRLPMGERRVPANKPFPAHEILHVDNVKDLPNFSMPKGVQKTLEGVGPKAAGGSETGPEGAKPSSGTGSGDG